MRESNHQQRSYSRIYGKRKPAEFPQLPTLRVSLKLRKVTSASHYSYYKSIFAVQS